MTEANSKHYLYTTWKSMRYRCGVKTNHAYKHYGGRGIKVCERWGKFSNFVKDMGDKPTPLHSLDRIDNDGGYSPENCRWATKAEQRLNRRVEPVVGATKTRGKWRAGIKIQGKLYFIGAYKEKEEAHEAYRIIYKEWYGKDLPRSEG